MTLNNLLFCLAIAAFVGLPTLGLPGLFYFFGLHAVSKGLLIFLDMEDNTRRAARK